MECKRGLGHRLVHPSPVIKGGGKLQQPNSGRTFNDPLFRNDGLGQPTSKEPEQLRCLLKAKGTCNGQQTVTDTTYDHKTSVSFPSAYFGHPGRKPQPRPGTQVCGQTLESE